MAGLIGWFRDLLDGPAPESDDTPYSVYTREFDREVPATDLNAVLGAPTADIAAGWEAAWSAFDGALQGWKTRHQLAALEASTRLRAALTDAERADTVVTLLIDHSGSMRGQSILLAAAAADVAQNFVSQLGATVEVLGFTTVSWKGGKSRRRWRRRGRRPTRPGRLCDLLHIIYRSADDIRASGAGWTFRPMLRPDMLKENVDGEALEWAAARLRACPQTRKVMLVISDGAPVDDSTLLANGPNILARHLSEVIARLTTDGDITLAAIGVGVDVSRYYPRNTTVHTPEDLGAAMLEALEIALTPMAGASHDAGERSTVDPTTA